MPRPSPGDSRFTRTVLVVERSGAPEPTLAGVLQRAGYDVVSAANAAEARDRLGEVTPDLVVTDLLMPEMDGLKLLADLRRRQETWAMPVILVTPDDIVTGLDRGADDFLMRPFRPNELLSRVRARIERPAVPKDAVLRDPRSGTLAARSVLGGTRRELARAARGGAPGSFAMLEIFELPRLRERFGRPAETTILKQVGTAIQANAGPLELVGCDKQGRFLILLSQTTATDAHSWLERLSRTLAAQVFALGDEHVRVTPAIGMASMEAVSTLDDLQSQTETAMEHATSRLDLHPVRYQPSMVRTASESAWTGFVRGFKTVFAGAVGLYGSLVLPVALYTLFAKWDVDPTGLVYISVVIALVVTNALMLAESLVAMKRKDPPESPGSPYPPATAVIAAYLPNEAATIVDTVEAFLRMDYPAALQIILAYNTTRDLPVEATLREIANRDSRFVPFRVAGSTSKAQNVNASLTKATGEFVGLFDADHHPERGSFARAWRWLSSGCDVVQGHCLVRNGRTSWLASLVAVEFELIYAVNHPGRARIHKFGIFGGSNGYWKTSVLRQMRMRHFMLTEDIDSSIRAVRDGRKIVSDPFLISRELAPLTVKAIWNQRMRWAQGWFQVTLRQTWKSFTSPNLSLRQRLGHVHLLAWNQAFPWLSLQIIPLLIYWIWFSGEGVDWLVPLFIFTTIFTLGTGPLQTILAYRLAHPDIKQYKRWFMLYAVLAPFYSEFKNVIVRTAHLKEYAGDRQWKVTPRPPGDGNERTPDVPQDSEAEGLAPDAVASPGIAGATARISESEVVAPPETPAVLSNVEESDEVGAGGDDGWPSASSDPWDQEELAIAPSDDLEPEVGGSFSSPVCSSESDMVDKPNVDWQPLEDAYPYVYLGSAVTKDQRRDVEHSMGLMIAIGIGTEGYQHLLGVAEGEHADPADWRGFMNQLRHGGLMACAWSTVPFPFARWRS